MQSGLFLNIIITQTSSVLQLLPCKYQPLLLWWNTFFILYLQLYHFNAIRGLYIKRNSLSCQCLDIDLHVVSYEIPHYEIVIFLYANVVERSSWNRLPCKIGDLKMFLLWRHHDIPNFQLLGIALPQLIAKPGSLRSKKKVIWRTRD